jgi:PAS domain S-box-containing protein
MLESEKMLPQIIQASPIPTFVMDKKHTITHCNKAFEKLIGLPADGIIGTHKEWLAADSKVSPYMADFIVEQAPEEEMVWYYGGKCRKSNLIEGAYEAEAFFPEMGEKGEWLLLTAAPLKDAEGHVVGAVETLQNVTERRLTEEALKESEKTLFQIVEGSSIPTFVINSSHLMTHCNRAFENLTGIRRGSILGTPGQWMSFYAEERPVLADFIVDRTPEEEIVRRYGYKCRKSHLIEGAYEAENFFPDLGENGKWLFFTAAPITDDQGNVLGAIETLQDVTERKRSEEALRESEKRYRTLLDFAPYPIVVFTLDGRVTYLNPAFSETFGWSLEELEGRRIDYIPPGLEKETEEGIRYLLEKRVIFRRETRRKTKDGRVLDVILRAAVFSLSDDEPAGELVILRDVTEEMRIARTNEALLRISMALPEYPDLEDLLHYVNNEVKRLLDTEGAIVILLDEIKRELFILGAAYDDMNAQRRAKEIRFAMNELVAGKVIETGESMIISETSQDRRLHEERDRRLGYKTRNLALVPLKSSDRIIGAICAINKKERDFDEKDLELLSMIAGTVALSVENARFAEELKKAYIEVTSLNRAKDKVINHLSHELKTPIAILSGSLNILTRRLAALPENTWKPTLERVQRNLDRIIDIQYQVHDIMESREYKGRAVLSHLLDVCADELQTLAAEDQGEGPLIERIRKRIEDIYGTKASVSKELRLHDVVRERLDRLRPHFSDRELEIMTNLDATAPPVYLPPDVLQKVIDGLIRNAVENTPDEGKIEIQVRKERDGSELVIRDYGIGILDDAQRRIFEGFFTTRDTMAYSTKKPFDFMAGGKGADLLRMKIFSERYHFKIGMVSTRCRHIPKEADTCPGRISQCPFCSRFGNCHQDAGTSFTLYFPPASLEKG